jgi:hypothetical protein
MPYFNVEVLLKQKELVLQSAKARLQWIDYKEFYSSTMNAFNGHPLQPDLSDSKSIKFIPSFPGICY